MSINVKSSQELLDFIRPDPTKPGSLYTQLARSLSQAIHEGMLEDGDFLLPQRDLAEQLGVSRVTLRKAVESLVKEGLLVQRQGAGTMVTRGVKQNIHKNLAVLNSFTEDMQARGMTPTSSWVSRATLQASPKEAKALNLSPGSMVSRFTRVRYASDTAMAYEIASVPAYIINDANEVGESLYAYLDTKKARPVRALQTMTAINADKSVSESLNIAPNDAVLYIERQGFALNDSPIEFTRSWYRGDIYDFVTELKFD
ncbi:GntR family transcriptional regulator [Reinekea marina]|uniref:GntR family transcriptional regulator n=1 Tax=Reinekea marina TaxID=1310421 RepID=A0ABV7WR27_9GAMM|nr:GntR family transcriptional regulator [Reinekea marina]MDN3650449.1 GntR family transcriptional regulator [Reinekea marina]